MERKVIYATKEDGGKRRSSRLNVEGTTPVHDFLVYRTVDEIWRKVGKKRRRRKRRPRKVGENEQPVFFLSLSYNYIYFFMQVNYLTFRLGRRPRKN